jgi:hypothetical protein
MIPGSGPHSRGSMFRGFDFNPNRMALWRFGIDDLVLLLREQYARSSGEWRRHKRVEPVAASAKLQKVPAGLKSRDRLKPAPL